MLIDRRQFIAISATALGQPVVSQGGSKMYGLIGKMRAQPGQRDALIEILIGTGSMPGCLSYIVARDPADPDGIWVTEVWDRQESHKASLALASVKEAIAKGRPLIAGFDQQFATEPVGGVGLPQSR
jgi:quinol monooxygenase YgiN